MYLRLPALTALIAIIATLAALALDGPAADAQTPPSSITLVDNTGQSDDSTVGLDQDRAIPFKTGTFTDGYVLTSVKLDFNVTDPAGTQPTYTVGIFDDSPSGFPNTRVAKLVNPGSLQDGLNEFTVSAPLILDPETNYHVLITVSADGAIGASLNMTESDDENVAAAGWSINNNYVFRPRGGGSWGVDTTRVPQISVHGYDVPAPPVVRSATVEFDTLVITFDRALDPDSVPAASAFSVGAGAETIAVSDVGISGSTVTLTLAASVPHGTTVTVGYTPPASNPLQDTLGVDVAQFTTGRVTVNTPRDFEVGVIFEAIGGEYRVYRDDSGNCGVERLNRLGVWARLSNYGKTAEGCRQAIWNAHRRGMGEEPLPRDSSEFPPGSPPDLNDFTCPSGWERSTEYGQQSCAPRNSEMTALSPERAREFLRLGLRPSDATTTNPSRAFSFLSFMHSPQLCGAGMTYAYDEGGNGAAVCTPHERHELVSCRGGNDAGISGRLCVPPPPNYNDFNRYPQRDDPTQRINSTVSYTSDDPNDTGTQEYGTPGCMASYWDDEKGGWVCTRESTRVR